MTLDAHLFCERERERANNNDDDYDDTINNNKTAFEVWGRMGRWTFKLGRDVHGCGLWRGIHTG